VLKIRDVGIALEDVGQIRQLEQLSLRLDYLQEKGFRLVEVDPDQFHLVIDGEIHRRSLSNWAAVLRQFSLRYSVHVLERLNLAYDPRHALCRQIMLAQIEICRAIGASTLVYHSGLQALDDLRYGVRRSLLSERELIEGAQREVEAFRELAPVAADAGVTIGIENGDSHQWEYALLAQHGQPRSAISQYHARLHLGPIVDQVAAIDHANVGITLDVGHLYIASCDVGYDMLEAVEVAAPWVRHLHVSDNHGRLDRGHGAERDRWAFGEADIHMPPGWGSIPYRELFARLPAYEGDAILEIKPGFLDYADRGLATIGKFLEQESEE
jgi:sugar phosphate isomerase/epimerase